MGSFDTLCGKVKKAKFWCVCVCVRRAQHSGDKSKFKRSLVRGRVRSVFARCMFGEECSFKLQNGGVDYVG